VFEVGVMLVAGIIAYLLEANRFPIAPAILGVVLGGMLEENFITSMIKSDGNLGAFFSRPIALGLAVLTMVVWFAPVVMRGARSLRAGRLPA
jgi:putative tricarboxylic transport membrane protein